MLGWRLARGFSWWVPCCAGWGAKHMHLRMQVSQFGQAHQKLTVPSLLCSPLVQRRRLQSERQGMGGGGWRAAVSGKAGARLQRATHYRHATSFIFDASTQALHGTRAESQWRAGSEPIPVAAPARLLPLAPTSSQVAMTSSSSEPQDSASMALWIPCRKEQQLKRSRV